MILKRILLLVLCLGGVLHAITAEYNIKSLGMNFAKLSLSIDDTRKTITVKAKSVQTGNIVAKLDNSYLISYDQNFCPLIYQRQIKQKKLDTKVITRYDHPGAKATMDDSATKQHSEYPLPAKIRDIFSFLAFCTQGHAKPGAYPIDANGTPWQAILSAGTEEEVKTSLGKFAATKYLLSFKQTGSGKTPYVDMVTFNLVNAETKLELWISDRGIPLKAKVKKGSQTMNWELTRLQP